MQKKESVSQDIACLSGLHSHSLPPGEKKVFKEGEKKTPFHVQTYITLSSFSNRAINCQTTFHGSPLHHPRYRTVKGSKYLERVGWGRTQDHQRPSRKTDRHAKTTSRFVTRPRYERSYAKCTHREHRYFIFLHQKSNWSFSSFPPSLSLYPLVMVEAYMSAGDWERNPSTDP